MRQTSIAIVLIASSYLTQAQTGPSSELVDQVNDQLGGEVETLAIAAGDSAFAGGLYQSDLDDSTIELTKLAVRFELLKPKRIKDSRWQWSPVLQAAVGYIENDSIFQEQPLAGNGSNIRTFAAQLGGGGRFYVNDHVSSAITQGFIYSRTRDSFTANNAFGQSVKDQLSGLLVDVDIQAFTVTPNLDLRYERWFDFLKLKLETVYRFYYTFEVGSSSSLVDFESHSQTWKNELDLEVRTPIPLKQGSINVGGTFARTQFWGGIRDAIDDDHLWASSGRIFWDPQGRAWIFSGMGVSGGYLWSDGLFGGWFGIHLEARL